MTKTKPASPMDSENKHQFTEASSDELECRANAGFTDYAHTKLTFERLKKTTTSYQAPRFYDIKRSLLGVLF